MLEAIKRGARDARIEIRAYERHGKPAENSITRRLVRRELTFHGRIAETAGYIAATSFWKAGLVLAMAYRHGLKENRLPDTITITVDSDGKPIP